MLTESLFIFPRTITKLTDLNVFILSVEDVGPHNQNSSRFYSSSCNKSSSTEDDWGFKYTKWRI